MANEGKKFYEFGKFRFDAQKLRLEHQGETVQLPLKSLETLKVLLEEKGETVTRESFFSKIWSENFVEDANLTVAISILRKTLATYEGCEDFIQTVPRRGYRFVGDAREKIEIFEQPIIIERRAIEHLTIEKTSPRPTRKRFQSGFFLLCALLGLAAAVGAFAVLRQGEKNAVGLVSNQAAANEAFLKGDALLQKRMVCESVPYFREAVSKDEKFAIAYANLASALAMCGDDTNEAEAVIAKALALDTSLAEIHATDGFIKLFRHWDWDGAESALRRAVALDPNSAKAHHWLGVCLSIRGRFRESTGEMMRAIELEPTSPLYQADLCQVYYFEGSIAAALNYCQKAQELDPNFILTLQYLRDIYLGGSDEQKAGEYEAKLHLAIGWSPDMVKKEEEVVKREGYQAVYRGRISSALNEIKMNPAKNTLLSFELAKAYACLGERENALHWLEEAVKRKKGTYPFGAAYLGVDPHYAFLRDDARFQAVLQKMNLAD